MVHMGCIVGIHYPELALTINLLLLKAEMPAEILSVAASFPGFCIKVLGKLLKILNAVPDSSQGLNKVGVLSERSKQRDDGWKKRLRNTVSKVRIKYHK